MNVDSILNCSDVNVAYSHLHDCINDSIELASYTQRKKTPDSEKWFDYELLQLRAKRQMLYCKKLKNNLIPNKTNYDKVKKKYEKLIILKKKTYYQSLIHQYNT